MCPRINKMKIALLAAACLLAAAATPASAAVDCAALNQQPVFHLVNPATKANLLTASAEEARNAKETYGFTDDRGTAFYASATQASGLTRTKRLYHPNSHDFLWAVNQGEITSAVNNYGYRQEGENFFVSTTSSDCTKPVYRLVNGAMHRYAVTDSERSSLIANGWRFEGTTFYGGKGNAQEDDRSVFFGVVPTESFRIADDEWARYEEIGIKTLRIHLLHDRNWSDIGNVVKKARARGIEVVMLVSYSSYKSNGQAGAGPWGGYLYSYEDAKKLIGVLNDAVPYFSALGATAWEIWNEQNGTWYIDAKDYALLIGEIYERFKYTNKWDPKATIVFGGMDAVNVGDRDGINFGAREYVERFYNSAGYKTFKNKYGHSPFDAFGIHPYATVSANRDGSLKYNYFKSSVRGVALEIMERNGDKDIPIWITELGSGQRDDTIQAAELRAYVESAFSMPQIKRYHYFQYSYPGEYFGLVNWDRSPRKSLFEYRDVVRQLLNR